MDMERMEESAAVREGYQILLRARREGILPTEYGKIRKYYQDLSEKCMLWATEVHGEEVRRAFSALENVREKSRFGVRQYRFRVRPVWEDGIHIAILCESDLTGKQNGKDCYHRISHVWNLEEETVLPFSQILELFGVRGMYKGFPFRPDGIYPEGETLVFFRNATPDTPFEEKRLPLRKQKTDAHSGSGKTDMHG